MRLQPGIVPSSSADIRHKVEVSMKFRGIFHHIRRMPLGLGLVGAFEKDNLRKEQNIVKFYGIS